MSSHGTGEVRKELLHKAVWCALLPRRKTVVGSLWRETTYDSAAKVASSPDLTTPSASISRRSAIGPCQTYRQQWKERCRRKRTSAFGQLPMLIAPDHSPRSHISIRNFRQTILRTFTLTHTIHWLPYTTSFAPVVISTIRQWHSQKFIAKGYVRTLYHSYGDATVIRILFLPLLKWLAAMHAFLLYCTRDCVVKSSCSIIQSRMLFYSQQLSM